MKRISVLSLYFLFLFLNEMHAQGATSFMVRKKSTAYVEFLGNSATIMSINYDRIIKQYEQGYFNASVGFGPYLKGTDYYDKGFNIPLSINYSYSPRNGHLEVGTGIGINKGSSEQNDFTRLLVHIRIGYKYQRQQGGIFFKTGFTPITPLFYFHGKIPKSSLADLPLIALNAIGIALGYSF